MQRLRQEVGALLLAGVVIAAVAACDDGHAGHAGHAGHGGPGMNISDPDAVPAAAVPGAQLATARFTLLGTAPQGYQNVAGFAHLARSDRGTTVTVALTGLKPDTALVAHVHSGSCAEGGGSHYKFDPAGSDQPPNEIHLGFNSDRSGAGSMTAEHDQRAGPEARSVVVHPVEFQDNRIACAPLS